jgi:hypothetical protein
LKRSRPANRRPRPVCETWIELARVLANLVVSVAVAVWGGIGTTVSLEFVKQSDSVVEPVVL